MKFAGEFYETFQEEEIIPVLHKMKLTAPIRNPSLLPQLSPLVSLSPKPSCSPAYWHRFLFCILSPYSPPFVCFIHQGKSLIVSCISNSWYYPKMSEVQGEGSWGGGRTMRKGPSKVLVVSTEQWNVGGRNELCHSSVMWLWLCQYLSLWVLVVSWVDQ